MRARVLCMCCETFRSATDLKAPRHADTMVSAALEEMRTSKDSTHTCVSRTRDQAASLGGRTREAEHDNVLSTTA